MADKSGLTMSPFTIDKNTDGVTYLSSDLATSDDWKTILTYAVPLGMAIEVTPANYHFGEYFNTNGVTSGNKITAGMTRILKANNNISQSKEIWSGSNNIFYNIGDEFQRPKIRVPVVVNASQKLLVQVKSLGTTLDVSTSNYYIECVQYYEEI